MFGAVHFGMRSAKRMFVVSALLLAPLTVAWIAAPALAVPQTAAASGPYWAAVKGDSVMLRSGPSVQSAYPFGRLQAGQPLKVLETQYGWARVQAVGPTFANLYGFVKADAATKYDAATKTLAIVGKTTLLAPNMDANFAPDKSWRQLTSLTQGDSLKVVEEVKGDRETFYSVRLPEKAEGWVNLQYIEPVSQSQAEAFETALKAGTPFPGGAVAANPPTATPAATPTATPGTTPASNSNANATSNPGASNAPQAGTEPAPTNPPAPAANPGANPPTTPPANSPTSTGPTGPAPAPGTVTNNPPAPPAPTAAEIEAQRRADEARQRNMEEQVRRVTYQDLEMIWAKVRNEPSESAELEALRDRYQALADDGVASYATREQAKARVEQLQMRVEVQDKIRELQEMKDRLAERKQGVADLDLAMKKRRPYDAMGRLLASTVYNGDRLPLLYKLTDSTSGYTLAYVVPGPSTKPSEALGLLVGIKGKRSYDETLRVNLITPDTIEVLETTKTAVVEPQ